MLLNVEDAEPRGWIGFAGLWFVRVLLLHTMLQVVLQGGALKGGALQAEALRKERCN